MMFIANHVLIFFVIVMMMMMILFFNYYFPCDAMDGEGGDVMLPLGVRCPGFLDCDIKVFACTIKCAVSRTVALDG